MIHLYSHDIAPEWPRAVAHCGYRQGDFEQHTENMTTDPSEVECRKCPDEGKIMKSANDVCGKCGKPRYEVNRFSRIHKSKIGCAANGERHQWKK